MAPIIYKESSSDIMFLYGNQDRVNLQIKDCDQHELDELFSSIE